MRELSRRVSWEGQLLLDMPLNSHHWDRVKVMDSTTQLILDKLPTQNNSPDHSLCAAFPLSTTHAPRTSSKLGKADRACIATQDRSRG